MTNLVPEIESILKDVLKENNDRIKKKLELFHTSGAVDSENLQSYPMTYINMAIKLVGEDIRFNSPEFKDELDNLRNF
jgi:hypothetical protein